MPSTSLSRLLRILFLIALSAVWAGAHAEFALQLGGRKDALGAASVSTPHVRAELLAHAPEGVAPGRPLWLGLQISHQPGWHTYWKNPGDSGLPTELRWQLPPGLQAGEVAWPVPRVLRVGDLVNYGYEGQVLLAVPVQIAPGFAAPAGQDALPVRLHASWLVCRVECIPEEGEFALQLPLRGAIALNAAAFAQAQAAQPAALPGASSAQVEGESLRLRVAGLPADLRGQKLALLPETPEVLAPSVLAGQSWQQSWDGAVWSAQLPLAPQRGPTPAALALVLMPAAATAGLGAHAGAGAAQPRASPSQRAWRAMPTVQGQWSTPQRAEVPAALTAALAANKAAQAAPVASSALPSSPALASAVAPAAAASGGAVSGTGLLAPLLGGLLGGLLLNLMPCVFPVLAIKLLGLARHGGQRRAQRLAGLAYTGGVLLSFLALGGLLLALRAAGAQLGWGFQLQSPAVVALLAALFTLLGLNLAGLFEFGGFVPSRLATLQARHPVVDAFLSGLLAVLVASPCTAPFMGASLGFALALPPAQALAVFAALGLGMALPFLAAALVPAVVGWLPRPGAWMQTFRHAMAFPMFATVAWLVWVHGQQTGMDGAGALLLLLVALAAVVWALTLRGRTRLVLATVLIAAGALLMGATGQNVLKPVGAGAEGAVARGADESSPWQPWSQARVAELLARGQPVFVDFTAAWCVTCQFNKRTTLSDAGLLADFAARRVALLRADWTLRDPAITAALAQLGRSGVPVYVLYAPGRAPQVFSEILSVQEVRAALP
ncbi:protein-disulfide reductase DsbD family protein [Extensimonas perlucida]|uniref:protein-disulfide reductase DsbD family protein n=1 Tax=Extensimonas perlucida TaxID=2590786 RepID=UPI0011A58548|nr:thioredoxin family protein [Extensimonas perlucida]